MNEPRSYEDYEVGAGWLDPRRLIQQLARPLGKEPKEPGRRLADWLGAAALTLVVLSWWQGHSVTEVAAGIIAAIKGIFT